MRYILILLSIMTLGLSMVNAQNEIINLYTDEIPYALPNIENQEEASYLDDGSMKSVSKVTHPTLEVFADIERENAPSVIICPGGGYHHLAYYKEGTKVAKWLNSLGIKAFVLKYRMPSPETASPTYDVPYSDLSKAVELVKKNAKQWGIDKENIGIMGFSAGGHLAATGAKLADFSILIYPVISMKSEITHMGSRTNLLGKDADKILIQKYSQEENVNKNTPKTFIVHAQDDKSVPVQNALLYYNALCENNISAEIHIYQNGGHGFGMGRDSIHPWTIALEQWFSTNKLID